MGKISISISISISIDRALFFCAYKRKDAKRKDAGCASRATPSLLGLSGTNSPPRGGSDSAPLPDALAASSVSRRFA